MKLNSFLVLLFCAYALCQTINNIRLIDHTSYAINVITKTINTLEERGWCNLKLPNYVQQINETILQTPVLGSVRYTNGFLVSIQHVDIFESTVQQVWAYNATAGITTVTVRATLRLFDMAVGFDIEPHLGGEDRRYTAIYVHPDIQYAISIIKDLYREDDHLDVTVVPTVPAPRRVPIPPVFRPIDNTTDILASTFDSTAITAAGIEAWAPEVIQPIIYNLVNSGEIPFPTFCYNCAVTVN